MNTIRHPRWLKSSYETHRFPLLCLLAVLTISLPAHALTINPTFDISIPTDPNGPTIIATINSAIAVYQSAFSDRAKFSLFAVACHEIDEILGLGSALNNLQNGDPSPTGSVRPEDLFRFDASGGRSFTTDLTAISFFSIDGTTTLARFNQDANGDFG